MIKTGWRCAAAVLAAMICSPAVQSQQEMIASVKVTVPSAPDGGSWDTVIVDSLLSGHLSGIQPDVRVCIDSPRAPAACTAVCPNTYTCEQRFGGNGFADVNSLRVRVFEVDSNTQQTIAEFQIPDARKCPVDSPCTIQAPGGPLTIGFALQFVGALGAAAPPPPPPLYGATDPRYAPAKPAIVWETPRERRTEIPLAGENVNDWGIDTASAKGSLFARGGPDRCCIDPNDIQQGGTANANNCFFLAALAAVALASPGTIQKAVERNLDGTYKVTLHLVDPNANIAPKVVTPLDATFPIIASWRNMFGVYPPVQFANAQPGDPDQQGGAEIWPMLFEKAYAQQHGGYASDSFRTGESSSYAMQTITGYPSERYLINMNAAVLGSLDSVERSSTISNEIQLAQMLTKSVGTYAVTAGSVPMCSANPPLMVSGGKAAFDFGCTGKGDPLFQDGGGPLVRGHSYFIREFRTDQGGGVVLGNPWGQQYDVRVSVRVFMTKFRQLHINKLKPIPCNC